MDLRVYQIKKNTSVEGPGKRYCIWVQGCSLHCKGCMNTATWSKNGGEIFDTQSIIADIKQQEDLEGITFLGGEPFEQSVALGEIAKVVQNMGLSVLTFSGYYLENLRQNPAHATLLENTDLLIDGPFEIDKVDYSRPWCGSLNQRYHFLSNRYNEEIFTKYKNRVEINIQKSGKITLNGMGDFKEIMQKMDLCCLK